jgi:hypothetical protein
MPGDPKEARAHAANCRQLAETASSPTVQKTFADLANQWNRLANELDDAYALLNALNELDLKSSSEADSLLPDKSDPKKSNYAAGAAVVTQRAPTEADAFERL